MTETPVSLPPLLLDHDDSSRASDTTDAGEAPEPTHAPAITVVEPDDVEPVAVAGSGDTVTDEAAPPAIEPEPEVEAAAAVEMADESGASAAPAESPAVDASAVEVDVPDEAALDAAAARFEVGAALDVTAAIEAEDVLAHELAAEEALALDEALELEDALVPDETIDPVNAAPAPAAQAVLQPEPASPVAVEADLAAATLETARAPSMVDAAPPAAGLADEDLIAEGEDTSDADVTRQLPAAERTVTDLASLAAADGTGEIDALDILEVVDALRTSKMTAMALMTPPPEPSPVLAPAPRPAATRSAPPPAVVARRAPAPVPPPPVTLQQPPSIAPLAIDVPLQAARPSYPSSSEWPSSPIRESTIEIARAAGIPSRASRMIVFGGAVLGMCVIAGSVGAMLGYARTPAALQATAEPRPAAATHGGPASAGGAAAATQATSNDDPGADNAPLPIHATPRTPVVTGAREEVTEAPILVAGKDAAASGEPVAATTNTAPAVMIPTPLVSAPAPVSAPVFLSAPAVHTATASRPTPPPAPAAAPAAPVAAAPAPVRSANAPPPAGATGMLRIPSSISGVLLDGAPHRVSGGGLLVTCGTHTVKAPGHASRQVVVPCGGSTSI